MHQLWEAQRCCTETSLGSPSPHPRCLWLEVVLVEGCGRGPFLQSLDMAGVTEQVVLQWEAAVAILIIELQTTVLQGDKNVP